MNYEQFAYLTKLLDGPSAAQLKEFDRVVNLHAMIKAFETEVRDAWQQFVHDKKLKASIPVLPEKYRKLSLRISATVPQFRRPPRPSRSLPHFSPLQNRPCRLFP